MESFSTASEKAYQIISEKILNSELKPGVKLSRRKMAELTGVSVIPVIEALNRLEEDGLVESKPQWGSFVVIPTPEKVQDLFNLREAIECQIARLLAEKITSEQANELRKIALKLDATEMTHETYMEMTYLHIEIHSKMAEFTGCKSLINTLKRINLFWTLCKAITTRRSRPGITKDWHIRLIDSFEAGDPDKAEEMMRIHVQDSLAPILEASEGYKSFGSSEVNI